MGIFLGDHDSRICFRDEVLHDDLSLQETKQDRFMVRANIYALCKSVRGENMIYRTFSAAETVNLVSRLWLILCFGLGA